MHDCRQFIVGNLRSLFLRLHSSSSEDQIEDLFVDKSQEEPAQHAVSVLSHPPFDLRLKRAFVHGRQKIDQCGHFFSLVQRACRFRTHLKDGDSRDSVLRHLELSSLGTDFGAANLQCNGRIASDTGCRLQISVIRDERCQGRKRFSDMVPQRLCDPVHIPSASELRTCHAASCQNDGPGKTAMSFLRLDSENAFPVRMDTLNSLMQCDPDTETVQYLLKTFRDRRGLIGLRIDISLSVMQADPSRLPECQMIFNGKPRKKGGEVFSSARVIAFSAHMQIGQIAAAVAGRIYFPADLVIGFQKENRCS